MRLRLAGSLFAALILGGSVAVSGCKAPAAAVDAPSSQPVAAPAPAAPVSVDRASVSLEGVRVHLTIDDVPYMTERGTPMRLSPEDTLALNQRLIGVLGQHDVAASVFVVCDRLREGDGTLAVWHQAGHAVGNHTHSHAPLNRLGPEAWLADAAACHETIEGRIGADVAWLRYPYLGYGNGAEARDAATAGLAELGERTAPVTIATTEWMYAYAYRRALAADDRARADAVVADFHAHMDEALREGVAMAAEVPGRDVPQTVLVHMNELVADEIGTLVARWKAQGVVFVDLPTAMADPVFAMDNHYAGTGGVSWLKRIRTAEDPPRPYWFGQTEGPIIEKWGPMPVKGEE